MAHPHHAWFQADVPGSYIIRTLGLTAGTDTVMALLNPDGSAVTDPATGRALENDDAPITGELGASLIAYNVVTVPASFVVRIRNQNPGIYGVAQAATIGYSLQVTRLDATATPTPTRTVTPTPPPTPTAANPDAYEAALDNTAAQAASHAYDLKNPIVHRAALVANANAGPMHTFHQLGDQDWLAIKLGALIGGSRLTIVANERGQRSNSALRAQPMIFLYRADGTTLFRLATHCFVESLPRDGACLVWEISDGDALTFANQTWYVRIQNFEPNVFGADINYGLLIRLDLPAVNPTVTPTPSHTAVVSGSTPTRTPEPVVQDISPAHGGRLATNNGGTSIDIPPGFAGASGNVSMSFDSNGPANFSIGTGNRTLRAFNLSAYDPQSGARINRFDVAVGVCVTFDHAEVAGMDQTTLRPSYIDPATGQRRDDGITITRLVLATSATDNPPNRQGLLCYKTTHFTYFELAGGELPEPTPRPTTSTPEQPADTATPTATPTRTPIPATATPTRTPLPAGATPTATATIVPVSTTVPANPTATVVVQTANGAVRVSVPPGVVEVNGTPIPIVLDINPAAPARSAAGDVYLPFKAVRIEMRTTGGQPIRQLQRLMTIEIGYTDGELAAAGLNENNLQITYSNDGVVWQQLPTFIDRVNKRARAFVDHLTLFALQAPKHRQTIPLVFQRDSLATRR